MIKITLVSILVSTLIFAGGNNEQIEVIEPIVPTIDTLKESTSGIPMGVSLLGGVMRGEGDNSEWKGLFGLEFSFGCLLSDSIRSQLQATYYDDDFTKMLQISANPHYIFNLGDATTFGAGPHIGIAKVEVSNESDTIFTYGVGASMRTDISTNLFIGAEARYEWTTEAEFSGIKDDIQNVKVFAKIGYSF